ncbi:MAG: flagellar basal body P-ring formation protein FlgA [Proteobacteria bacterium]|nr:flagellar basal body P-ring formation protein FlgA [Pseudomonadota bacterium]
MKTLSSLIVGSLLLASVPAFASPAFASDVRIVVPARDILRGEVIADADLSYANVAPDRVRSGVVLSMNDLDGMEARRFLKAGEPVRNDDVRHPILVAKGATVTMTFAEPGITLTATGRAVSEGGMGETVTVLNPISYRQITAVVTGIGQVRAGGEIPVASNIVATSQLASTQN